MTGEQYISVANCFKLGSLKVDSLYEYISLALAFSQSSQKMLVQNAKGTYLVLCNYYLSVCKRVDVIRF